MFSGGHGHIHIIYVYIHTWWISFFVPFKSLQKRGPLKKDTPFMYFLIGDVLGILW